VEHFFRHEFGRLGAVLTRSLGVRRLDHVEDAVQAGEAMGQVFTLNSEPDCLDAYEGISSGVMMKSCLFRKFTPASS
jgi:hypothetical protein